MSNGSTVRPLVRLAGLAIVPLLAASAVDRSCWLRDAAAPTGSVAYALCEQGNVWVTTNGGAKWASAETKAKVRLRSIVSLDPKRVIVIGDEGTMLATNDGGKTWRQRETGTKEHLLDITFQKEAGWVVGFQGVVLHTTDGGLTWKKQVTGTTQTLESVYFLDANHGWAVGWAGTILITSNGGEKWQFVKADAAQWSLSSVYFRDTMNGWAVGFGGEILRSRDGGLTWKTQPCPVRNWLTNVFFETPKKGWIAFDDGFLTSEDGGETWTQHTMEGKYFLSKLVPSGNSLYAVGQSALLRRTGGTWQKVDNLVLDTVSLTLGAASAGAKR
jgi:photosystem II stability/assembly factor-like uncharacterized protein